MACYAANNTFSYGLQRIVQLRNRRIEKQGECLGKMVLVKILCFCWINLKTTFRLPPPPPRTSFIL